MNYKHHFHAGNFADVFKHLILIALLKNLRLKEKPFFYLDTHAGAGTYRLNKEIIEKTNEAHSGIFKLLNTKNINASPLLIEYLDIIKSYNTELSFENLLYPGSPAIGLKFIRSQDKMILIELNKEVQIKLKTNLTSYKTLNTLMEFHHQDAYLSLKALLPQPIKRGIILIDPPYEEANELKNIIAYLTEALNRFALGIYTIWYPIKDRQAINQFYRNLENKLSTYARLIIEFGIDEPLNFKLNACGILIINPPWQLQTLLEPSLKILVKILGQSKSPFYSFNLNSG
ncbi:MAG: hypothetical protein JWM09_501 [Francisellaceae bacterium]|nr:hypothetical protein [Francisellaceae bacterium]